MYEISFSLGAIIPCCSATIYKKKKKNKGINEVKGGECNCRSKKMHARTQMRRWANLRSIWMHLAIGIGVSWDVGKWACIETNGMGTMNHRTSKAGSEGTILQRHDGNSVKHSLAVYKEPFFLLFLFSSSFHWVPSPRYTPGCIFARGISAPGDWKRKKKLQIDAVNKLDVAKKNHGRIICS